MPDRPLLILPVPGSVERLKKHGGGNRFQRPSRERQNERLTPRFDELQRVLEARRARIQTESQGLVPEEVVVLETVGTVEGFIRAVEKIPGMEWLSEVEEEDIPPDDDFFALDEDGRRRPDKPLRGRLFMIFTNQDALRQMLALWASWQNGSALPWGLGPWKDLFAQLRDVRAWGTRDRLLETGVLDDWRERVSHGQEIVPCEIELWFRHGPQQRRVMRDRIAGIVRAHGGEVVNEAVVEEISYHALLARLPVEVVQAILEEAGAEAELVLCEQIQFFRASGQMAAVVLDDDRQEDEGLVIEPLAVGRPVVALFDGLPLQGHQRLEGRLIVDDPDGFEERYPANERRHGTAMASLILHGDLAAGEAALSRPLYVRPILLPDPRDWVSFQETVPENTLVVDLLHRAIRRLFEGERGEPPVAPDVSVVNFSIGIRDRPFDGSLSPLARLLDWLAWRYRVLFVVSAGNYGDRIELACARNVFSTLAPAEVQGHVVRAVAAEARRRRLLSPAEGVNALTVGALHQDASGDSLPPLWSPPYAEGGLPSPINAQGMGYRRAIKPDILAPGGRIAIQEHLGSAENVSLRIYGGGLPPGQQVATPGNTVGDRKSTRCTRGTSNATALVSRAAVMLHDVLDELRGLPGSEIIDTIPRAVWLKALLAHGADWGAAGDVLDNMLRTSDNSRQLREYLSRLLGYGSVNFARVRECTEHRVTALSGGSLAGGQAHIHRFPLPPSLSGERGHRRLTITLAWLTPVNPRHQNWRRADLWFASPNDPLRVERRQADWQAVRRGTLQHEIFEGTEAAAFVDGTNWEIQVSCRADAGALEEDVPYALVTTLEVAEEIGVRVYEEVRVRVQERVRVAASPN